MCIRDSANDSPPPIRSHRADDRADAAPDCRPDAEHSQSLRMDGFPMVYTPVADSTYVNLRLAESPIPKSPFLPVEPEHPFELLTLRCFPSAGAFYYKIVCNVLAGVAPLRGLSWAVLLLMLGTLSGFNAARASQSAESELDPAPNRREAASAIQDFKGPWEYRYLSLIHI